MARSTEPVADQLELFAAPSAAVTPNWRRRYVHRHTPDELAAFERTNAVLAEIRPDFLNPGERLCPGGCCKVIHGEARHCGRRWCDAVRPTWGRAMADVLHKALDAYCELYGSEAKVLSFAITCTARPGWLLGVVVVAAKAP